MKLRYGIVLPLQLLLASGAFAQDTVDAGDRIKVRLVGSSRPILGTVSEVVDQSLLLTDGTSVNRSAIVSLERSLGTSTCERRGAVVGGVVGLVASTTVVAFNTTGCLVAACLDCSAVCEAGAPSPAWLVAGTAAGAGLGALVGHRITRERWRRVRLDAGPALAPSRGALARGFQVRLTW